MEDTLTKSEFLDRLQAEYARLEATVTALAPEQMLEPNVVGDWSVKDVLAHLVLREQLALQELIHAQRGEAFHLDPHSEDRANALAVSESRERSVDEVIAKWQHSYQEVLGALQALADTDYAPASRLAEQLGDTIEGTFANNTYEHYAEHEEMIRAHWHKH